MRGMQNNIVMFTDIIIQSKDMALSTKMSRLVRSI